MYAIDKYNRGMGKSCSAYCGRELSKETKIENRNLTLETRKNSEGIERLQNGLVSSFQSLVSRMRSIKKLPKDASRSRMEGATRRGAYLEVCDPRGATEDKEMRSIFGQRAAKRREENKEAGRSGDGSLLKVSDQTTTTDNTVMRSDKKAAMRDKQNADAGSKATGSVLSVHDPSRATEDKVMRSISWQRGYTLIELMIVMAILSLLAGLFIPQWHHLVDRNRVKAAKGIGEQIQTAMEAYKFNFDQYPSNFDIDCGNKNSSQDIDDLHDCVGKNFSFDFRRELSQDKWIAYTTGGAPPTNYTITVKANISTLTYLTITPKSVQVIFNGESL